MDRFIHANYLDEVAATFIGVKYTHYGRASSTGLDCYGLVIEYFKRLGFPIDKCDVTYEKEWWKNNDFIATNDEVFDKVDKFFPGGVISLKTGNSKVPNHLVVALNDGRVLNTDEYLGAHVLRIFTVKSRIVQYYRHKALKFYDNSSRKI